MLYIKIYVAMWLFHLRYRLVFSKDINDSRLITLGQQLTYSIVKELKGTCIFYLLNNRF